MNKKVLVSVVIVCCIGILVLLTLFLNRTKPMENRAYNAIPADAAFIIDIRTIEKSSSVFERNDNFISAIAQSPYFTAGCDFITKLDSTIMHDERFMTFAKNELLIVVKQIGQNKLDFLYILPLRKDQNSVLVEHLLQAAFTLQSPQSYTFNKKAEVYSYKDDVSERGNLSFSLYENTLIISESKVTIENALKGLIENKNITNDANFQKIKANDSKVQARFYIHYDRFAKIFGLISSDEVNVMLKENSRIATWSELDLFVSDKSLRLNGYITTDSVAYEHEYMNIFRGQSPVRGNIQTIMPSETSHFIAYGISNKQEYRKNYETYLSKNSYYKSYRHKLDILNDTFAIRNNSDIVDIVYSWIDDEIAYVQLPSFSENTYENTFAVLKIRSKKTVEESIKELLESYAQKNNINNEVIEFESLSGVVYPIYKMPIPRFPQLIWGSLFSHVQAKFVTFIDSYVIFANSEAACKVFINDKEKGKTLSADSDYAHFDDNVKSSYSMYVYTSLPHIAEIMTHYLDAKTYRILHEYVDTLKTMEAVSYQLIADNGDKIYNDIFIMQATIQSHKPDIEWRTKIDTTLAIPPVMFTSHRDEPLTLVQDVNNNLYLIDNGTGKIQWTVPLDGKILGSIQFVDALANKKQQYLFNTAHSIYLLDRNGKNVGNFPLQSQVDISAPVGVFDYDSNQKYRIMVPTNQNNVELYSMEGALWSKMPGWNFQTENPVKDMPRHFIDDGKDYIVFSDQYHVYIVNRKGEIRIPIDELVEKAPNSIISFESGAEASLSRFILTDVYGNIKEIFLDGTVKTTLLGTYSSNHWFCSTDINADGNGEYIFIDENKVDVYTDSGKKQFSYHSDENLSHPFIFMSNEGIKIAAIDEKCSLIYVINSDGAVHKGFPIYGKSYFSASAKKSDDKAFSIIVGGEQNLLYNYTLK